MNEETKKILRERARRLAREPVKPAGSESIEIIEFTLAGEHYGFETEWLREVFPLSELTPLPGTPRFLLGIANVRGRMVSVIDLKKFFDLPDKGITELNKVVILHSPEMEFGVLADAIIGIRRLDVAELRPSLPTLKGVREEYLRGVTPGRLAVLDAFKLLSDKKMVVNERVEV